MRKLLRKNGKTPRVMVADKLNSYAAANKKIGLKFEHRQHKATHTSSREGDAPIQISLSPSAIPVGA